MAIVARAHGLGRAALAVLLAVAALPIVLAFPSGVAHAGPQPVFTMFVPFSEQQISDGLFSIYGTGGSPSDVVTTIDITSAADNSIMYWDHWEDGYEADIANPVQPSTEVWGDGNAGNGAPPGVPTDLVNAGTIIFIQNNVALPRNPAVQLFDGRDKVASTRGFAMSRAGWDLGLGTLHAGAVAATDLSKYGTQFTFPVGENTGFSAFDYTGVTVMASDDNTVVEFDTNGDGGIDQTNVLAEGETVYIDGGINAGGTVSASKPIQTHLITGERNSRYEGRWYEVFPAEIRGDEYVAAAGSTSAAERVTVFLQNPGDTTITVAVDAQGTADDTNLMIAPGAVASYDLPNGSGARFSSPGNPFIAVSGTVAVTGNTTWYDWGYSLVPTSSLTPGVVVGWGAGNPDGTQNYSPIWVAPLADTTIYVDIDGDAIVDQTIPNVNAYESVQIIDTTDNDMTGSRIYTIDGTLLSVAWGQDPAGGECCNAYDLGSTVLPSTALVTTKTAELVVDVNGDGNLNPGDTLEYTISSVDAGALSLTNIVVQDNLPATLTYVPNTTTVDGVPEPDDTVGTPFPVDGSGVLIPVLAPGASADVVFRAQLVDPFPPFTQTVRNTVLATGDQGSANATSILPVLIPDLYVGKSSNAGGPLNPGQIFDYLIDVSNINVGPQSGIDVTDTLPPELTWLSTTVARWIDDPAPGGSDVLDDTFSPASYGNNPTEWVADWVETDSAGGGPGGGNVRIVSELGSNRVRLRGNSSAIERAFDGAAWDEATLAYDYRPDSIDNGDWVSFQISTTGGTSWIELDRVIGPLTAAGYTTLSYDLTRYLGQDVHLRWVTSPGFSATGDSFYLDNVAVAVNRRVIEVVPGGAPPALYTAGELLTGESLTITVSVQLDAAVDPATDSITNSASAVSAENPSPVMSDATDPIARASVGDTVWHDQDGDGVVDGGEPRLAGVTVTLSDSGGTPIGSAVTDGGGNYLFADLDPGDYTVVVTAGVPAGMATTFDADGGYDETTDVSLGFGEDDRATNFGYAVPVALGDRVFGDVGGDGVENGPDFGIDGLNVTITGPSHPGGTSTTTVGGTYGFSNLLPGTYTVDVDTSPLSTAAYSTTGGDSQVVALTSGNDDLTVDFGYVLPAAIGDTVFHDLNADGDQDPGEPGFVGVEVTITGTGLPVGGVTTTTDATGFYLFSDLDAGNFSITVSEGTGDLPVGYSSSTGGFVELRSVLDDDVVFDVDFGFWTQATIGDFVFDDVNGNGAWDAGEPGIPGVPITVTGPTSTATVTDAFGGYDVSVDPGTYTVVPDTSGFPPGTVNTFDGASPSVTVASTDDLDTADFGYTFPSTLGDFVWHDLDADGVQDPGEPGLDGVDLTITGGTLPPGGVTTTTAGGGAYLFSSLDPGTYTISVDTATVPAGYVSSTGGDSIGSIVVVSGTARTDLDFGYRGTADIGDLIFHDLAADGGWDPGEPGLTGVVVTLTGPGVPPGTTDTTDASGNYLFADLDPGTYTITVDTATVPAGYTVTAGTDSRSVTLLSDIDVLTADLGYATTATIGDFVFDDLDGDGVQDPGEPGFDGVTVTLDDGITPITQDTVSGAYDFTGVAPGTYTVTVDASDLPPGVVNTLGGVSRTVTVASAEDEDGADFGYYQPASVGDLVWDDLDGDGVFDPGEPGFAGVTITLTGGTLPPSGITDVTDGTGAYDFTGLAPGTYTATLTATDLPPGAVNTFGGTSQVATVQSGDDENTVDFGFHVPATIGDMVWDDLDGDGIQDPGEPGIAGVTVTLTGPGIPPGTTDTTDGAGLYAFPGLAPGAYTVTVDTADLSAGATSTTGGFSAATTLTSGADDLDVDFGVANPITIGDAVFDDLDGDGVQDPGEPGLAAVDVTITGGTLPPVGVTVATDGTGFYEFTNLLPATYTAVVDVADVPAGYTASSPTSVVATYESGDDVDTVDFGFVLPAELGDFVFDDLDGDGAFDAGEPGLAGVTLELSGPGVAPGTTVTTTGTGLYSFGGLQPGTFTVTVTAVPAGYTNTLGGASQVTTLESGETDVTLDFGYYLGASIGDFVWDDLDGDGVFDAGEPGFDGVTVILDDGVSPITQDTVNGAYDFTGLVPGTYTVSVDTADLPPGAVNTVGGASQAFTVASGDDQDGGDFGFYVPGTIGDYVWNDLDGDGTQDDGPPPSVGIGGVTVTVTGPSFPGGTPVVTAADGSWSLGGLAPGDYTVDVDTATLPAGATSTTGGFTVGPVTVSSGATITTVDFGVAFPASVGDLVFTDANGNTVFDAGDSPLAGVQLTLTGPGVPPGTTDVTDAAGAYGFGGLGPGTYTVTVDGPLPPGALSTTGGSSAAVTLSSGETDATVDFGYAAPAAVGDTVFDDLDGDGTQQPAEPGIAGITVTLTGGDLGGPVSTTTDGSGGYSFAGLTPGDYVVSTGVAGSASTTGGDSQNVGLVSGETDNDVDFGYAAAAALGDTVFHDLDGDGIQDPGEPGLAGVTVTLAGPGVAPGTTDVTDAAGGYGFNGLAPGSFTVTIDTADLPSPAYATTTGGDAQVVVLTSGETDDAVDFGYAAPAVIGDAVWDDLDGDGVQDPGEPGFDAVTVTLDDGVSPISQDTVGGSYSFTGIAPGTYTLSVDTADLPAGAVNTFGGASQTVTVESTETETTVDFGYYRPGSIGDLVFVDDNGNGTINLGEPGLDGVQVTLTGPALGAPLTTTTAGGGSYSFTGLAPGTYTATLTGGVPAGATSTTGGNAQTITIESGDDELTVDFGLAENVTVGDLVWHDLDDDGVWTAGEPGIAGVGLELRDASNVVIDTATSDGAGTYLFLDVAPGTYTVVVDTATVPAGYTTSTAESFPITVTSGVDVTDVDVGYATTAALGDLVWDDLDGDGVLDPGEPGIDGLTVTLTGGVLGAPLTTTTAGGGAYSFAGLDPGTYTVTVTPPVTGASTTGGDARTLTLASGEVRDDVDFGYALAATIGDRFWHDLDGDGVQDAGEPGLGGVAVTLAGPSGPTTATTDGVGAYVFAGLPPGSYTVSFDPTTVPVGVVSGTQLSATTASSISVPLQSGEDVVTADIGFATTGAVDGTIYEDDDADGVEEPGESGLVGVTVELVDGGGSVVATTATDAAGDYSFSGIAPGDYTVRVGEATVPPGFVPTSPATVAITVVSDEAVTDVDVGYARPATIGDRVWHDLDADGIDDPGESGLGGVTVELVDGGGSVIATAVTDAAGAYAFSGVDPGAHTVRVELASLPVGAATGAAFVASAGVPTSVALTVVSGGVIDTIDFAFHTTADLGDLVWHDLDADGVPDAGEPGLALTVELVDGGGTVVASGPTAADGSYALTGIAPGTYTVLVSGEPAGYSSTTGNDPSTVVLVSDQVDDTVDFGLAVLTGSSIGNEIWEDLDGDGVRDAGEPGIAGVLVELFSAGTLLDSRVTASTGSYLFANLASGSYDVRVDPATLPAGYAATTAGADAGNTQSTTVASGGSDLGVDFGYAAPAVVGDLVWHDLDGDGVRDAGEPGIGGVVVELIDGGGTVVATATTDAAGAYSLAAVLAGDYTVAVDAASIPIGATSGSPMTTTTALIFSVTLASNSIRADLDVGLVTTATIGDTIFDDLDGDGAQDPGESGIGGVTVVLTDGGGGTTSVVTAADGHYEFGGVAPGAYSVGVDPSTLPAGAAPTTAAAPVPVAVASDELAHDVDLGYALPASLAGVVFVDSAGDGLQTGDAGMAGVTIELLDSGGTVIATTTTAADGSYLFTGLLPGGCRVRPILPAGFGFTIPDAGDDALDSDVLLPGGETATVWISSGEDVTDVDAGLVAPATIGDTVWVDLDGDGVQGPGEPGLGGVTVELRTAGGALIATTTTDAAGAYSFTTDPGQYTVSVLTPGGYRVDPGSDVRSVTVLSGETDLDVDFGLIGAGSVAGDVVYDVSADGVIDVTDPGHAGVTVLATWAGPDGSLGTADDATFTAITAGGAYALTDLPPGDYSVVVDGSTLPDGLVDPTVDPDGVVDLATVVPVAGAAVTDVDFASTGTASLGDNVFRDDDEDGVLDPGEPGIGGVTVTATVTTTSGVRTFTTVTDADGFYRFDDLPAGDYVVTLDPSTIPVGLVPSIASRSTTLVINGADDSLDMALVPRIGPVAADDDAETPQNTSVTIPVVDNDVVPAGTTVTVIAVTQPPNGTVSIDGTGTVRYTPDSDFAGDDSFTYTICDLDALATYGDNVATRLVFCSTATVTVTTPPPAPGTPGTATVPGPTTTTSTPAPATAGTPAAGSPATPLPAAGSDSRPIQTLALLFLAAGVALLLGSRRRDVRTKP